MKSKNAKDIGVAENLVKVIAGSTNKQTIDKSKELDAILKALKNNKGNSNEGHVVDVIMTSNGFNYRLTQSQVNQLRTQVGQYSNSPIVNYLSSKGFTYNPNLNKNAQCFFNNDRAGAANTNHVYSKLTGESFSKWFYVPSNDINSILNKNLGSFANECKSEGYTDFGAYMYLYEDNTGAFVVKGAIMFGKKK
ncbi:hypothetical protein [Hathewaya massiliensis]|uniref:hypothetical protein n=1 Tax=Hathewaya massiliensis TaxID=1964382 RepID=UPI00115B3434|nr:hypothetical protein [Hathewaya massiliensis]